MEDVIGTIISLIMFIAVPLIIKAAKNKQNKAKVLSPAPSPPRPSPPRSGKGNVDLSFLEDAFESLGIELPDQVRQEVGGTAAPTAGEIVAEQRQALADATREVKARAIELADTLQHEPPNRRFLGLLREFVPERLNTAGKIGTNTDRLAEAIELVDNTDWILDVTSELAAQRRDTGMARLLGDADRLAEACYAPIVAYASENNLPLQSNYPVTYFGAFDLQIWTGFIPTTVAPIFLPQAFIHRLAWWPALAHEIGHDFYASVKGLDEGLRADLGLASEAEGRQLLRLTGAYELPDKFERIFGVWFEELFCDVFGALMVGPAYIASQFDLDFDAENPLKNLVVALDPETGTAYDPHPPQFLRFLVASAVLDRVGLKQQVNRIRQVWTDALTLEGQPPDYLLFRAGRGYLPVPLEPFVKLGRELAMRLYLGPLRSLGSVGLRDIPGLDYGPHRHNTAAKARESLLAGKVPDAGDPRAIICGAVLAARQDPKHEEQILHLAREAIPAIGTYDELCGTGHAGGWGPGLRGELVEAMVLGAALSPRARSPGD